jgi:molybdopterin-containing oxidoreductase family iron-sulfur binding subunit
MYDPDRSQSFTHNRRITTWGQVVASLIELRSVKLAAKGQGVRILTGPIASPTVERLLKAVLAAMPEAKWHVDEPVGLDSVYAATKQAFGQPLEPMVAYDKARVIVSLDADFLGSGPDKIRAARQFSEAREPKGSTGHTTMNRLFAAEPTPSLTGAAADHRIPVRHGEVASLALAMAQKLGVAGVPAPAQGSVPESANAWLDAVAKDLQGAKGQSIVLVGADQPVAVQAVGLAINEALGNVGTTLALLPPARVGLDGSAGDLTTLIHDMDGGQVDTLLILGTPNPAYTSPADLNFAEAISKVKTTIHLGSYANETSALCQWHLPEAHPFEVWGDLRSTDGTVTLQQPLIAPLYAGKTVSDVLSVLLGQPDLPLKSILEETHKEVVADRVAWRKAVHDGFLAGSESRASDAAFQSAGTFDAAALAPTTAPEGRTLEILFRPDPHVGDGSWANSGWLQELPKPFTKLTWDNPLLLGPATADALGVKAGDVITLTAGPRKLDVAVWVVPGQAPGTGTLHLGYGRTAAGRVGNGIGFNAYALRTTTAPTLLTGVSVTRTGKTYPLASTISHWNVSANEMLGEALKDREILREGTLAQFNADEHSIVGHTHPEMSMYPPPEPQRVREEEGVGNAWAMVIDLNTCIGCNACVMACVAENNIPVIGKDQIIRQREMHWIRIDTYFQGTPDNPKTTFQPVPCMQCEKAPCEIVCPVAATAHSAEGLNDMVYNRCVGTRYCSNNCPYKVRRFNFLQYSDMATPSLKLLRNPDVTVRTRGVMEKCTYCVQRINHARINVEKEGREKVVQADGLMTACQSACPTRGIVFGNLNDPTSDLVKAKANPRNYAMLASLNARPRTTYLAKLSNPNPDLAPAAPAESTTHDHQPAEHAE